jgi:hypothetical protein
MDTKTLESIPEIHPVIKFSALINMMEMLLPVEHLNINNESNLKHSSGLAYVVRVYSLSTRRWYGWTVLHCTKYMCVGRAMED